MTRVIGYAYEAALHCPDCTYKRFMHTDDCKGKPDENGIDEAAIGGDGNAIGAVLDSHEPGDSGDYCDDCKINLRS